MTQHLETVPASQALAVTGFEFGSTGLVITGSPSYEDWERCGHGLGQIEGAIHWWLGDWARYGETRYGEKYAQAVDETGYAYGTLANDKYVSGRVEFSRRRDKLSFAHHQEVAALEPEDQAELLEWAEAEDASVHVLRRKVREYKRNKNAPRLAAQNGDDLHVETGDFRELGLKLPADSVDLIFTDPPYDTDSVPLYGDLAALAARVLRPGGSLICYAGHHAVPAILELMGPHLRFWWLISCQHSGSAARLQGVRVYVGWKPLLWFVKERRDGDEYVSDCIQSEPVAKEHHGWEQSPVEARYYIEHLTPPGGVVLDPMAGGGTTLLAALELGRQYHGFELSEDRAQVARARLYERTRSSEAEYQAGRESRQPGE